jgi:hypothetical protein
MAQLLLLKHFFQLCHKVWILELLKLLELLIEQPSLLDQGFLGTLSLHVDHHQVSANGVKVFGINLSQLLCWRLLCRINLEWHLS